MPFIRKSRSKLPVNFDYAVSAALMAWLLTGCAIEKDPSRWNSVVGQKHAPVLNPGGSNMSPDQNLDTAQSGRRPVSGGMAPMADSSAMPQGMMMNERTPAPTPRAFPNAAMPGSGDWDNAGAAPMPAPMTALPERHVPVGNQAVLANASAMAPSVPTVQTEPVTAAALPSEAVAPVPAAPMPAAPMPAAPMPAAPMPAAPMPAAPMPMAAAPSAAPAEVAMVNELQTRQPVNADSNPPMESASVAPMSATQTPAPVEIPAVAPAPLVTAEETHPSEPAPAYQPMTDNHGNYPNLSSVPDRPSDYETKVNGFKNEATHFEANPAQTPAASPLDMPRVAAVSPQSSVESPLSPVTDQSTPETAAAPLEAHAVSTDDLLATASRQNQTQMQEVETTSPAIPEAPAPLPLAVATPAETTPAFIPSASAPEHAAIEPAAPLPAQEPVEAATESPAHAAVLAPAQSPAPMPTPMQSAAHGYYGDGTVTPPSAADSAPAASTEVSTAPVVSGSVEASGAVDSGISPIHLHTPVVATASGAMLPDSRYVSRIPSDNPGTFRHND